MTGLEAVFGIVGIATAASAILTVTSKNLVHAALFLAATLAGIGATFLVLRADFVAWVQIVVYVGAIAVLFLFGLMLTRAPIGREALDSQNRGTAAAVSGAMFVVLAALVIGAYGDAGRGTLEAAPDVATIGLAIFTRWVFPFEFVGFLLLAGLVGAILLSRRESGESGEELEVTRIETSSDPSTETETVPLAEPGRELERSP